jgi:hypothetical protein
MKKIFPIFFAIALLLSCVKKDDPMSWKSTPHIPRTVEAKTTGSVSAESPEGLYIEWHAIMGIGGKTYFFDDQNYVSETTLVSFTNPRTVGKWKMTADEKIVLYDLRVCQILGKGKHITEPGGNRTFYEEYDYKVTKIRDAEWKPDGPGPGGSSVRWRDYVNWLDQNPGIEILTLAPIPKNDPRMLEVKSSIRNKIIENEISYYKDQYVKLVAFWKKQGIKPEE